jgi:hypothetical protein
MGKVDWGRVILGGIVAGIIIDIVEFVLNGIVLAGQWSAVIADRRLPMMGTTEIVWFNIVGLATGIAAVWTYAAIRPRFGSGPKTAVCAGLLIWFVGYLLADAFPAIVGMLPSGMVAIMVAVGLVEIIVATLAGAYIYRETS